MRKYNILREYTFYDGRYDYSLAYTRSILLSNVGNYFHNTMFLATSLEIVDGHILELQTSCITCLINLINKCELRRTNVMVFIIYPYATLKL